MTALQKPTEHKLCVWKWAENNVSGVPEQIIQDLMEREVPAAIQPFEPAPFEDTLDHVLAAIQPEMRMLLWVYEKEVFDGQVVAVKATLHADPADEALKVIGTAAVEHGLIAYDATTERLVSPCLPKKFELTRYDIRGASYDPSLQMVLEAVEGVDVRKGANYAILSNHTGNYVQALGCDGKFGVEWRTYKDRTWQNYLHLSAGHNPPEMRMVFIGVPQHHITKFASEVLTLDEVKKIFTAFYNGEKPLAEFHWRDMTYEVPQ